MGEPVKVVIEVQGGFVVSVLSGVELDVVVVDHDRRDAYVDPATNKESFADGVEAKKFMRDSATKDFL